MNRPDLIPAILMARLIANGMNERQDHDPLPVLKLFNPAGPGTWLVTEIAQDADSLFGLCDLDMGEPELGYVSLDELEALKLPYGLRIERDRFFQGRIALSRWAILARRLGSIRAAEHAVAALQNLPRGRPH